VVQKDTKRRRYIKRERKRIEGDRQCGTKRHKEKERERKRERKIIEGDRQCGTKRQNVRKRV